MPSAATVAVQFVIEPWDPQVNGGQPREGGLSSAGLLVDSPAQRWPHIFVDFLALGWETTPIGGPDSGFLDRLLNQVRFLERIGSKNVFFKTRIDATHGDHGPGIRGRG